MSCHLHCLFLLALVLPFSAATISPLNAAGPGIRVKYFLDINENVTVEAEDQIKLLIVCNNGELPSLLNVWKTVYIRILATSKNYEVFVGENETIVAENYKASQSIMNFVPTWQIPNRVDLLVYNKSCFGIYSLERYKLLLRINRIDFWKVLRFLIGLFLFFAAPYLSGNVLFYYSSGVTLGICASLLIIVFVISRLIPKKVGAVTFLVGGWAMVIYVIQMFLYNVKSIMMSYQGYVVIYLTVVGFISFAICYRRGHVTDVRTRNLIKWGLQGVSLLIIFLSTEWHEAGFAVMLIAIAIYAFPDAWKAKIQMYWIRRFPPKVKLLSEDDYYHQTAIETKKALEGLRKHCMSPDCNSWKIMRRLKTPYRFAEFIEGDSHLTDEEILNHELEQPYAAFTDDEDDTESDSEMSRSTGANGYAIALRG